MIYGCFHYFSISRFIQINIQQRCNLLNRNESAYTPRASPPRSYKNIFEFIYSSSSLQLSGRLLREPHAHGGHRVDGGGFFQLQKISRNARAAALVGQEGHVLNSKRRNTGKIEFYWSCCHRARPPRVDKVPTRGAAAGLTGKGHPLRSDYRQASRRRTCAASAETWSCSSEAKLKS